MAAVAHGGANQQDVDPDAIPPITCIFPSCQRFNCLPPIKSEREDWKIYRNLSRVGAGTLVILIIQFALTFYLILNWVSLSCEYREEVWFVVDTIVLFVYRVAFVVSLHWCRFGGCGCGDVASLGFLFSCGGCRRCRGGDTQRRRSPANAFDCSVVGSQVMGQRLLLFTQLVLFPIVFVVTVAGLILVARDSAICVGNEVRTMSLLVAILSLAQFIIQGFVLYGLWKAGDIHRVLRTPAARANEGDAMSSQFLVNDEGRLTTEKVFTYHATHYSLDEPANCTICLEEITKGVAIRDFPCGHPFHLACIDRWLRQKHTCPSCLRVVKRAGDRNALEAAAVAATVGVNARV
eukprot:g3472.t1